jgi:hypothetical protein
MPLAWLGYCCLIKGAPLRPSETPWSPYGEGNKSSYFFGRVGFVPLSVVPSFKLLDVGGSSVNREACFWQLCPALHLERLQ